MTNKKKPAGSNPAGKWFHASVIVGHAPPQRLAARPLVRKPGRARR